MRGTYKSFLLAAAALVITPTVAACADHFSFSPIVVTNSTSTYVNGIWNNEAVGQVFTSGSSGAFIWANGSTTVNPAFSTFTGVSTSGLALGIPEKGQYTYSTVDLTSGDQTNFTVASKGQVVPQWINSAGFVVGFIDTTTKTSRHKQQIFEYNPSGTLTLLGHESAEKHFAVGIDDTGLIVSPGVNCDIYENGRLKMFKINGATAYCASVPANGQFGGSYILNDGSEEKGFISKVGRHYTSIEVPGAKSTYVTALNSKGEIGGDYKENKNGLEHGFLYVKGQYYKVNYPNSIGTSITGISETGSLIGYYETTDSYNLPFIAVCSSQNGLCTH